jgi:hypothetical protein
VVRSLRAGRAMAQQIPSHQAGARCRPWVAFLFPAEIAAATDDFADACRIGGGDLGGVFRGSPLTGVWVDASHVAVKRIDLSGVQGGAKFLQEVQTLGACRHENIVPLLAVAAGVKHVCLVTPLMQGGSLEDRLALDADGLRRLALVSDALEGSFAPLTWRQRLAAGVGALKGLVCARTHTHTCTAMMTETMCTCANAQFHAHTRHTGVPAYFRSRRVQASARARECQAQQPPL